MQPLRKECNYLIINYDPSCKPLKEPLHCEGLMSAVGIGGLRRAKLANFIPIFQLLSQYSCFPIIEVMFLHVLSDR